MSDHKAVLSTFLRHLADDCEDGRIGTVTVERYTEGPVYRDSHLYGTVLTTPEHDVTRIEVHHQADATPAPFDLAPTVQDLINQWGFHPAQIVANADNSATYSIVELLRETWATAVVVGNQQRTVTGNEPGKATNG